MTKIGNSQTNTSSITFRDALQSDSYKTLKSQVLHQAEPSRLSLYISFCTYHMSDPPKIIKLVQNSLKESTYLPMFLKALYSVSIQYMNHTQKKSAIEKVYQQLLKIDFARKALLQNCDIPTQLRPILKTHSTQEKFLQDSQQSQVIEVSQTIHFQVPNNNKIRKGIAKLMLLLTQINHSFTQTENETIWKKILAIIGEFQMHPIQLLDVIIQSTILSKNYQFTIFCFKKIAFYISPQAIMNHLILKQAKELKFSNKQSNEYSLASTMQQYSINGLPTDSNITAFVLLAKATIINQKQIFLKLQPSSLNDIYHIGTQDDNNVRSKQSKQKINNDRKQQFLTQLILLNAFDIFKNLIAQFKIKVVFLEYAPLYYAMSELIEWLIDPLFKTISFSSFFPKQCKRKFQNKIFPAGFFCQLVLLDQSFSSVFTLSVVSGGNIFAKRSTYLKLCRLFSAIFDNHKNLRIIEQDKLHVRGIIYRCIYWYLIPSIQFYNHDTAILTALNSVLERLPLQHQQILLLKSLENKQSQPHQLIFSTASTSQQLKTLLNRISNSNLHIIQAKIKQIVYSRPLSSLLQLFNRLLLGKTTCIMKSLVKIVASSPGLIKKVFILYVLYHLLERQDSLVMKNSHFTSSFNILIDLINIYLAQEKQNAMLIELLIGYFIEKMKPQTKPVVQLTSYQFFSSQINFFLNILQYSLPIHIGQTSNIQHQYKYNSINGAGICLKVTFLQKIGIFMKCKHVRENITNQLLNNKSPFQSYFYKLLILMFQLNRKVFFSSDYNLSHIVYYTDQINGLTNYLIQFVHLEANSSQLIQTYFSFDLFDQLLNKYTIPLQTCFALLRKSIFDKYCFDKDTQFFCLQDWQRIKQSYYVAINKHLQQKVFSKQTNLKNLSAITFDKLEMQKILKSDLYLLFWLLPYEISQKRKYQYKDAIKSIYKVLKQPEIDKVKKQKEYKQAFIDELETERSNTHKLKQISVILNSPSIRQFCLFGNNKDSQNDFLNFIKKCVITRALVSKSDAYYSWSFLLNLVRQNQKGPYFLFEAICTLREEASKLLVIQTQRQATEILPFLANLPNYYTEIWQDEQLLGQRLSKRQILTRKITKKEYQNIIKILRKSSRRIINYLVNQYSKQNQFILKNIVDFICACRFIPMFKDQAKVIKDFFDQISKNNKYGADISKIQIARKIIIDRQKIIQSKSIDLIQNSEDNYSDKSQSVERKSIRKPDEREEKSSDRASCTSETKSSVNFKTNQNKLLEGAIINEELERMNLFSEGNKQKEQKADKIVKHSKEQKNRNTIINPFIIQDIENNTKAKEIKEVTINLQKEDLKVIEVIQIQD